RRFPAEAPPGEAADLQVRPGASERPDPPPAEVGSRPGARAAEEGHELTTDSFAHYFRTRRRRRARSSHAQDVTREAAPALLTVEEADEPEEAPSDAEIGRASRRERVS